MPKKKTYNLPQYQEPQEKQEKIDEEKQSLIGLGVPEIARLFVMKRKMKKGFEAEVSQIDTEMQACSQLLVEQLQDQDVQKVTLSTGETVFLETSVYPSVTDKTALRLWVIAQGMEEILSVHSQTLIGLTKERLNAGEEPPPGVKAYNKTKAKCLGNGN
jgi:hypothetical protein